MKYKKLAAMVASAALTSGILAGCGGSGSTNAVTATSGSADVVSNGNVSITFFHSKGEIHEALEQIAEMYEEQTGVHIEVQVAGAGESPYTKITTAYNAGTPPTIAMLDTTDVVSLAESKALDLSGEDWVSECDGYLTTVDGKVYSFPFCIEGRGIIYNKAVIEKTLGNEFDPSTITSYDALKSLLESLRMAGMENPVIISSEDWSLGAHQLQYIYEWYDGTNDGAEVVINELKDGSIDLLSYNRFTEFLDTLDLLLEYNYYKADPLGAVYEQDPIYLYDGEAALWFNGCWAWPNIAEAGASPDDEYGFLPYVVTNDTSDFANYQIQAASSKQIMIDAVKATEAEQNAAKDFLNWLVYDETGQKALVELCNVIPAAANNTFEPLDPLSADIKNKMANDLTFSASAIVPGDHWSVLGASMQKYIAGQSSREELARDINSYWQSQ